jgi:methylase of polypeptide subunit release factors
MNLIDPNNQDWFNHVDGYDFKLNSGIVLNYIGHLDCGGTKSYSDYITILQQLNKGQYKRAYEWCAGIGAVGFEILGQGLCEHVVFSDYYDLAITNCYTTAEKNNIRDKVTGYTTPRIGDIPDTEVWDLVVGNPPHNWSMVDFMADLSMENVVPENIRSNLARQLIDDGMETHKEFFQNIRKHVTDNADLLIWEADRSVISIIEKMALDGGLKLISEYPMPTQELDFHRIYHFKPI